MDFAFNTDKSVHCVYTPFQKLVLKMTKRSLDV